MQRLVDLLVASESLTVAPGITQLEHSLQVATRARAARAAPDLVFGALMHDVGRLVAPEAHGRASAELIAPFVSPETYWVIRIHDEIRLPRFDDGDGPVSEADRYANEPWFPLARIFAEDWDRYAFVPNARTLPLPFFLPMMDALCNP
ncbi:HD domain-containing protein [Cereibacter changlensis]|uniref:HD domain-containing protein n=1 Tax=Cereibacter changlensis TaxID=402884 RepID=A0A4U0YZM4_9RHOB|nr:HD domain-containing protein [Cereibacter changlensis]TKA98382.1 HD domain-containing protein [Cereibacter changlensis]